MKTFIFLTLVLGTMSSKHITIYFFDNIEEEINFRFLKEKLENILHLPVHKGENIKTPESAFNEKRNQFRSETFIKILSKVKKRNEIALGIVDKDLYVDELNFVFGLADTFKGSAIVAVKRLRNEFYGKRKDENLFLMRVLKECVHEIGHLLGLPHCTNPKCIMYFSNSILDTDKKGPDFCSKCRKKLKELKIY